MAGVNEVRRPNPILVALAVIGALVLVAVILLLVGIGMAFKSLEKGIGELSFGTGRKSGSQEMFLDAPNSSFTAGIKLVGEINSELAEQVIEKIEYCITHEKVTGVFLEVDSPGGAVVPSQEMYDGLMELKAKKPVVAYVKDVAASGAYYTIAAATEIIANRGSMIGSIGVIMAGLEYSAVLEWLKVKPVTLKTGKLKDSGSPSRPWTSEDKDYLDSLLEETRQQFASDVQVARNLPGTTMTRMSDGRVVLATEAVTLKLVDAIGSKKSALKALASRNKKESHDELFYLEDAKPVPYFLEHLMNQGAKTLVKELSFPSLQRK